MFNYVCLQCGKIQTPIRKDGDWEVYDTKCSSCGGELTMKRKSKTNENRKRN